MRISAPSDQKMLIIRRTVLFANDHLLRNGGAQRRPDHPDGHLQQTVLLRPFDFGHPENRPLWKGTEEHGGACIILMIICNNSCFSVPLILVIWRTVLFSWQMTVCKGMEE